MTFLRSLLAGVRDLGCPNVVATPPATYTLPMRVDSISGALWIPKVAFFTAVGTAVAGVNATPSQVNSLTIPDQGVPGTVLAWGHLDFTGTTAGDLFDAQLDDSTTAMGVGRSTIQTNGWSESNSVGWKAMPAGAPVTLRIMLFRTGGSGTASSVADYRYNSIQAMFIPT